MTSNRQEQFLARYKKILEVSEELLLENYQSMTLDDLAKELDIAKGTLYKHFKSKNELLLELIIQNERKILEISEQSGDNFKDYAVAYMLFHLEAPEKTIILHQIEENLTMTESGLKALFNTLYEIRQQRILCIKDMTKAYLDQFQSNISIRDYLSYIWSLTYGGCLLLNSSYYQRSIGSREKLIQLYTHQALTIPSRAELNFADA
ncbi:helix-turn-helix domain-containing protein [Acinetobacter sp. MD2(2019)]|uniref:TetR/AcrR family transcriptional regulator n=1 Tax=Acinetobacter sp. MD2(2019) TaxID=2605273 RepID=UPI002D1EBF4C|nr:helix-turn-helix domain-containing protein [Acinetobacter sp. MD2(2019)]MEB3755085.1 TetR/AcrR family transcriptional regulator [Acinetobacter sp. MD2(2019)]